MLDGRLRVEQLRSGDPSATVGDSFEQTGKRAGRDLHVVVQEQQCVALGVARGAVVGDREAEIARGAVIGEPPETGTVLAGQRRGVVARRVVDESNVEVRRHTRQRIQTRAGQHRLVAREDDDGEQCRLRVRRMIVRRPMARAQHIDARAPFRIARGPAR
jgi:hypothetical protein